MSRGTLHTFFYFNSGCFLKDDCREHDAKLSVVVINLHAVCKLMTTD